MNVARKELIQKTDADLETIFKTEVANLYLLNRLNPTIHRVKLHDAYSIANKRFFLLLDPVANQGNLKDYLEAFSKAEPKAKEGQKAILQRSIGCLTVGLCAIHEKGLFHGDFHAKNILFNDGRVLIADFNSNIMAGKIKHYDLEGRIVREDEEENLEENVHQVKRVVLTSNSLDSVSSSNSLDSVSSSNSLDSALSSTTLDSVSSSNTLDNVWSSNALDSSLKFGIGTDYENLYDILGKIIHALNPVAEQHQNLQKKDEFIIIIENKEGNMQIDAAPLMGAIREGPRRKYLTLFWCSMWIMMHLHKNGTEEWMCQSCEKWIRTLLKRKLAINEGRAAYCEGVQADIERRQANCERLQADIKRLQEHYERLQADGERRPAQSERLQAENERLQAEKERLDGEVKRLKAKRDKVIQDMRSLRREVFEPVVVLQ